MKVKRLVDRSIHQNAQDRLAAIIWPADYLASSRDGIGHRGVSIIRPEPYVGDGDCWVSREAHVEPGCDCMTLRRRLIARSVWGIRCHVHNASFPRVSDERLATAPGESRWLHAATHTSSSGWNCDLEERRRRPRPDTRIGPAVQMDDGADVARSCLDSLMCTTCATSVR